MIAIVDYCKGNLRSVQKGLEASGAREVVITADPAAIARADAVVLPGVGAFADASAFMGESDQAPVVREAILAGKPFLGICLGLHLLFAEGDEGSPEGETSPGLNIIDGLVTRLPKHDAAGNAYKVPHVGWNAVEIEPGVDCPLLEGIPNGEYFYFTHSFIAPESPFTAARVTHSVTFPCFVDWNHTAFGIQFHPEKSSDAGLAVLRNFVRVIERG